MSETAPHQPKIEQLFKAARESGLIESPRAILIYEWGGWKARLISSDDLSNLKPSDGRRDAYGHSPEDCLVVLGQLLRELLQRQAEDADSKAAGFRTALATLESPA